MLPAAATLTPAYLCWPCSCRRRLRHPGHPVHRHGLPVLHPGRGCVGPHHCRQRRPGWPGGHHRCAVGNGLGSVQASCLASLPPQHLPQPRTASAAAATPVPAPHRPPTPAGPCAFVQSWAAFIIGAIGGLVYFIASKVNLHLLKVGPCAAQHGATLHGMRPLLGCLQCAVLVHGGRAPLRTCTSQQLPRARHQPALLPHPPAPCPG